MTSRHNSSSGVCWLMFLSTLAYGADSLREIGTVRSATVTGTGTTYIDIKWEAPNEARWSVTHYMVAIQKVDGFRLGSSQLFQFNAALRTGRLFALDPGTDYRISIWPEASSEQGTAIYLDSRTKETRTVTKEPFGTLPTSGVTSWRIAPVILLIGLWSCHSRLV